MIFALRDARLPFPTFTCTNLSEMFQSVRFPSEDVFFPVLRRQSSSDACRRTLPLALQPHLQEHGHVGGPGPSDVPGPGFEPAAPGSPRGRGGLRRLGRGLRRGGARGGRKCCGGRGGAVRGGAVRAAGRGRP